MLIAAPSRSGFAQIGAAFDALKGTSRPPSRIRVLRDHRKEANGLVRELEGSTAETPQYQKGEEYDWGDRPKEIELQRFYHPYGY